MAAAQIWAVNPALAILLQGLAAYPAPTSQDAYDAFTDRILVDVRYSGDVLAEPTIREGADFPQEIVLHRCVARDQRAVKLGNGAVVRYRGYDCIFEVFPNAEPAFRSAGFFRHDGMTWEYYGPVRPITVPSPSEFDPIRRDGDIIGKPGSIIYDGSPRDPVNENYNPYRDLFDASDRVGAR